MQGSTHQLLKVHFSDLESHVAPLNVGQLFLNFACDFLLAKIKKRQGGGNVIGKKNLSHIFCNHPKHHLKTSPIQRYLKIE